MKQGFTLVELAIVIVIIGLLVGGVLQGQELIKQAENRALIKDIEGVRAAIYTFKSKYDGIPGDMVNATQFWGTDPGGCSTNVNQTPRIVTCNGDGNGVVRNDQIPSSFYESFRFWQQLSNAKLIPGTYPGSSYDTNYWTAKSGINVPAIRNGIGMYMCDLGTRTTADTTLYAGKYPNVLTFGKDTTLGGGALPFSAFITGEQMRSIDEKIDDGLAVTGKFISFKKGSNYAPSCTTSTDPLVAQYNITSDVVCSVNYIFGSF